MTLTLSRNEVAKLLTLDECIVAVEAAFRLHGEHRVPPPAIVGMHAGEGGFHIKAALLPLARSYFAAKVNGNFSGNPARCGLPAIQGVVYLADGSNGEPLAVMDSIEITILRTGAATAVAAKFLARADSRVATVCGCGNQGRVQLRALSRVLGLRKAFAWDVDSARSQALAEELSGELGFEIVVTAELATADAQSDVVVTCTPSRTPFLRREHLRPGAFVAAVGADSPDKQELDASILSSSKVVVDVLEQCATIGELHHAPGARVHAELGEVVARRKPGRESDEEIIVFDSTGTALQDVAAAAVVYEKALRL
jgi:ornithine cyclodeaminase/alanine dehydrogenase-like protein (mu-crystallin family)